MLDQEHYKRERVALEARSKVLLGIGIIISLILAGSAGGVQIQNKGPIIAASVPGSAENPSVVETIVDETSLLQALLNSSIHGVSGSFNVTANATLGKWKAQVDYLPTSWNPGTRVRTNITLFLSRELLSKFKEKYPNADKVCVLITAERDFDSKGLQHVPWDYQVSTLLTPGGLPIEGGGSSALSRFAGYAYRTPVDIMLEAPISAFEAEDNASDWYKGTIVSGFDLPKDLPPGIYRVRLDFGFETEKTSYIGSGFNLEQRWYNFNGNGTGLVQIRKASHAYILRP